MMYQKNKDMEYIQADETSLAVFDPESGDTHFFNETGIDILCILENPSSKDTLIQRLCEIYQTRPEEIVSDVEEFITEAVSKKVVVIV